MRPDSSGAADMLKAIKDFFEKSIRPHRPEMNVSDAHRLQVATAALLFEMMRVDQAATADERERVITALRTKFDLASEETEELLHLAEREAEGATDYYQFTSLINAGFTLEQKERVIEYLWQVAYADGEIDRYERHFARKIAELLHVPQKAFVAAKIRARRSVTARER